MKYLHIQLSNTYQAESDEKVQDSFTLSVGDKNVIVDINKTKILTMQDMQDFYVNGESPPSLYIISDYPKCGKIFLTTDGDQKQLDTFMHNDLISGRVKYLHGGKGVVITCTVPGALNQEAWMAIDGNGHAAGYFDINGNEITLPEVQESYPLEKTLYDNPPWAV